MTDQSTDAIERFGEYVITGVLTVVFYRDLVAMLVIGGGSVASLAYMAIYRPEMLAEVLGVGKFAVLLALSFLAVVLAGFLLFALVGYAVLNSETLQNALKDWRDTESELDV